MPIFCPWMAKIVTTPFLPFFDFLKKTYAARFAIYPRFFSPANMQYDRLDGDTDSSCSIATIERPQSAKSKGADTGFTFGSPGMMALAMQRAAVVSSAAEKTP